jgi:hypothetical protein
MYTRPTHAGSQELGACNKTVRDVAAEKIRGLECHKKLG